MIDEIARPDFVLVVLLAVSLMVGGLVLGWLIGSAKFRLGASIFAGSFILGILMFVLIGAGQDEWKDSVQEQVGLLPCEDLQEAYEIYKMEYIKERYSDECVNDREWWK